MRGLPPSGPGLWRTQSSSSFPVYSLSSLGDENFNIVHIQSHFALRLSNYQQCLLRQRRFQSCWWPTHSTFVVCFHLCPWQCVCGDGRNQQVIVGVQCTGQNSLPRHLWGSMQRHVYRCTTQCNPKQFEHSAEVPAPLWGLTLCAPGPLWGLTLSNVCRTQYTVWLRPREVENSEVLPIFLRRSRIVPQSDHLWGWAAQWQVVSVWSSGTESGLTAVFAVKMIGNDSRRQPLGGSM